MLDVLFKDQIRRDVLTVASSLQGTNTGRHFVLQTTTFTAACCIHIITTQPAQRNAMSAYCRSTTVYEINIVRLLRSYCLPSLLIGYKILDLNSSDYHRMNVIWNNAFRKIFHCYRRESVSCVLYGNVRLCKVMQRFALPYITDKKICFGSKKSIAVVTALCV